MIGIIILNYNEWDLTIACVKSIRETIHSKYTIYLVDNNSSIPITESCKNFINCSSDIVFLSSNVNKGYAGGNNIGLQKAIEDGCNYYLITNNDVIFKNEAISNMTDYLKNNSDVGIVGPKVFLPDGKIQEINMVCKMDLKGKYLYLLRKTPLNFISRDFVRNFHGNDNVLKKPFQVYAVSGCCFMISKEALKAIYPLDEGTFLYEEENIIGYRMEKAGLKTIYCTDSEIIHIGGISTSKISNFSYICLVNSELYYLRKYLNANTFSILPLYFCRFAVYVKMNGFTEILSFIKHTKEHLLK